MEFVLLILTPVALVIGVAALRHRKRGGGGSASRPGGSNGRPGSSHR